MIEPLFKFEGIESVVLMNAIPPVDTVPVCSGGEINPSTMLPSRVVTTDRDALSG